MKICIPMDGESISQHFEQTGRFLIVALEGEKVVSRKLLISPGNEPGLLSRILLEPGITHIIAGGIGRKARDTFEKNNIAVICGVSGNIYDAIQALIAGRLVTRDNYCEH